MFQDMIDAVDEIDLATAGQVPDVFSLPGLEDIQARTGAVQERADAAGCSDDDMRRLLTERIGRLEARTVFGQAVIEGLREQGLFGE